MRCVLFLLFFSSNCDSFLFLEIILRVIPATESGCYEFVNAPIDLVFSLLKLILFIYVFECIFFFGSLNLSCFGSTSIRYF